MESGIGLIAAVGQLQASGIGSWAGGMLAAVGQALAAAVGHLAAAVGPMAGIGDIDVIQALSQPADLTRAIQRMA